MVMIVTLLKSQSESLSGCISALKQSASDCEKYSQSEDKDIFFSVAALQQATLLRKV